jgi:hypothetical protein
MITPLNYVCNVITRLNVCKNQSDSIVFKLHRERSHAQPILEQHTLIFKPLAQIYLQIIF